jgi:DNA repair and recombination protein RAD54B
VRYQKQSELITLSLPLATSRRPILISLTALFSFQAATTILNKPTIHPMSAAPYYPSTYAKPFKAPTVTHTPRPSPGHIPPKTSAAPLTDTVDQSPVAGSSRSDRNITSYKTVQADSFYAPKKTGDKIVLGERSSRQRKEWGGAIFDPNAEGAVVMPRPPAKILKA